MNYLNMISWVVGTNEYTILVPMELPVPYFRAILLLRNKYLRHLLFVKDLPRNVFEDAVLRSCHRRKIWISIHGAFIVAMTSRHSKTPCNSGSLLIISALLTRPRRSVGLSEDAFYLTFFLTDTIIVFNY